MKEINYTDNITEIYEQVIRVQIDFHDTMLCKVLTKLLLTTYTRMMMRNERK